MIAPSPDTLDVSLFNILRTDFGDALPMLRCTKATLVHLSHTLEDLVLTQKLPALLFTGFQESSHWREETERYRALAEVAQQVCIFAGGTLPPESHAGELHVTLRGDDPLRQEWFVVLLSSQFAALLCGQDRQVPAADEATREFDTIFSFDPAVIGAVLDRLEQVVASYRPERLARLQQARASFPPAAPNPQIIAKFTVEMVRFEERIHRALHHATAALDAQLRWRDDLTATLVHDLRSPLQSLSLALTMIQHDTHANPSTTQQLLQVAERGAANLQDLVQLVLDTNQLSAGRIDLAWRMVAPAELIDDAIAPLQLLIDANRLTVTPEIDPRVTVILCDEQLLRRVIQNLLGNAIKFTPPGGRVIIRVAPDPSEKSIEIQVHDSGAGIAPAMLANIFDRYYQADPHARNGNGLGLYFCRLAVEAHGGSIRAASQVGMGTTITIALPTRPPIAGLGLG